MSHAADFVLLVSGVSPGLQLAAESSGFVLVAGSCFFFFFFIHKVRSLGFIGHKGDYCCSRIFTLFDADSQAGHRVGEVRLKHFDASVHFV